MRFFFFPEGYKAETKQNSLSAPRQACVCLYIPEFLPALLLFSPFQALRAITPGMREPFLFIPVFLPIRNELQGHYFNEALVIL